MKKMYLLVKSTQVLSAKCLKISKVKLFLMQNGSFQGAISYYIFYHYIDI